MARDTTRAAVLFEKGCQAGHGMACVYAGDAYGHGEGTPRDDARAGTLYGRAVTLLAPECASGDATACHALGMLYYVGQGVAQDSARARDYFEKACRGGNQNACEAARRAGRPPDASASRPLRTRPRPRP